MYLVESVDIVEDDSLKSCAWWNPAGSSKAFPKSFDPTSYYPSTVAEHEMLRCIIGHNLDVHLVCGLGDGRNGSRGGRLVFIKVILSAATACVLTGSSTLSR